MNPVESLPAPPRQRAIAAAARPAFFTYGLMVLLVLVFWGEVAFSLDKVGPLFAPSLRTLAVLGGDSHSMVILGGEWWRIFTAPLLHADLWHLFSNLLAIFLIGRLLEPLVGWRWMAAIFSFSAIGGSLISISINPPDLVCVGASGGCVGLFAASLVGAYRIPAGRHRRWLVGQSVFGLVTTFLALVTGAPRGIIIDFGAHYGGLIGGVAICLALLALWPGQIDRPKRPNFAAAVAVLFFGVALGSLIPIVHVYRQQVLLAPDWPTTAAEMEARASQLVFQYPHDPRARLAEAIALLKKKETPEAEAELRTGLAEKELLSEALTPDIEIRLQVVLAATLDSDGNKIEAKQLARQACRIETVGFLANVLREHSLCS